MVTFTGRYLDSETGLVYFRARQYSTALGRFVGRDKLVYYPGFFGIYSASYFNFTTDPSGNISLSFNAEPPTLGTCGSFRLDGQWRANAETNGSFNGSLIQTMTQTFNVKCCNPDKRIPIEGAYYHEAWSVTKEDGADRITGVWPLGDIWANAGFGNGFKGTITYRGVARVTGISVDSLTNDYGFTVDERSPAGQLPQSTDKNLSSRFPANMVSSDPLIRTLVIEFNCCDDSTDKTSKVKE